MIDERKLQEYLEDRFGHVRVVECKRLGAGVHGTGFSLVIETTRGVQRYVIKDLAPEGLGHDYPSDRAQVFLLAYDEYGKLPRHVKPFDVVALMQDGSIRSISGGREYFLIMEMAEGTSYFFDLEAMKDKDRLESEDREKIKLMAGYLSEIHSVKKESRTLYWRKIRDTIGHGECLMGVFDSYPDGHISYEEMAEIEQMAVQWRPRLKRLSHRLCQIHGDFHPGNIWFKNGDFVLLDRSRGPWGDGADDVTALTINYIFYSIMYHDRVRGPYEEALRLFYDEYIRLTGDRELLRVVAPFYAFRASVVAHPVFYPQLRPEQRGMVLRFARNVLSSEEFVPERVNSYIG